MQEGGQGMLSFRLEKVIDIDSAQSALITYVTAGFPTAQETPDIMMAMEAGGAGMHHEESRWRHDHIFN